MSKKTLSNTSKSKSIYQSMSLVVYILTILVTSFIFLFPPNNFDAKAIIMPVVALLFVSAIGLGQKITGNTESKALTILGTLSIAVLMTFVGLFIVAAVAWFVGVAHAQY